MARGQDETFPCQICRQDYRKSDVLPASMVHGALCDYLHTRFPEWDENGYICHDDLNRLRREYITEALTAETSEMESLQESFHEGLVEIDTLAHDLNSEYDDQLKFSERVADQVAEFGGSWIFLFSFALVMAGWIGLNTVSLLYPHFDPYPYILLNLVLSCMGAVQAPVILMSQNRQEAKDRLRAKHDLQTNLKAELEIRNLNNKMDQLLNHQWQRLLEIQQMQMEMMEELTRHRRWEEGDERPQ